MQDLKGNGNNGQFAPRLVDVNHIRCALIAHEIPKLAEMRQATDSFSLKEKNTSDQATALFYLISICHRLNWDFVLGPFAQTMWELSDGFSPDTLNKLREADFRKAFGSYRRDDGGINYKRRLESLREIAQYVHECDPLKAILGSDRISGEHGVAKVISHAPIYREDPLLKKCNALLHELVRRKLISVVDSDTVEPAIDYHIMRLYLRTGRVVITDDDLVDRLIHRQRVRIEVITQLRRAVAEALKYTAWVAKVSVSTLNDVEWAFARRACRRDKVWCSLMDHECPLAAKCMSAYLEPKNMLTEPDSRHGHY